MHNILSKIDANIINIYNNFSSFLVEGNYNSKQININNKRKKLNVR